MNTIRKGNIARLQVIRAYERDGYKVSIVERVGRFVKSRDMWGLFDVVAIHPVVGYAFIQVTTRKPHDHEAYKKFTEEYYLVNQFVEVLQYVRIKSNLYRMFKYRAGEIITDMEVRL